MSKSGSITFTPAEIKSYYSARIPKLVAHGNEWRARCVIHDGKRPDSLAIDKETGKWKCHSECQKGGDILEFEMELTGCEFKNALKSVSGIVGREVGGKSKPDTPRPQAHLVERYTYVDKLGKELFRVERWEASVDRSDPRWYKTFKQAGFDPARKEWSYGVQGITMVPYRLDELAAADTVILVEGEKDVEYLRELGYVATTTPGGAAQWKDEYAKYFAGKDVIVIPDIDERKRGAIPFPGQAYAVAACRAILPEAWSVKILELDTKDVADWIDAGGTKTVLDELIKDADAMTGSLLDEWAAKWAIETEEVEQPEEKEASHASEPMKANALAVNLMHDNLFASDANDNTFIYTKRAWRMIEDPEIRSMVWKIDDPETTSHNKRQEAVRYVKAASHRADIKWNNIAHHEVPVSNGVLELKTAKMRPHRPEDYLETYVPWDFEASAKCPVWEKTVKYWFEKDEDCDNKIKSLQEFFGYVLFRHAEYKKCLVLYGKPDSGKSIALYVLQELVGNKNCCSISPEKMDDPRQLAPIRGKMLNIMGELRRDAVIAEGGFKQLISGGDAIQIDPKFKSPEFIIPTAKHVFATNTLPVVKDDTMATWNRMLIIPFNRSIPVEEQDSGLKPKLIAEMAGILAWAAHGAARLVETGGEFTEPAERAAVIDEGIRAGNPIFEFAEECLVEDDNGAITNEAFHKAYCGWAGKHVDRNWLGRMRSQAGIKSAMRRGDNGVTVRQVEGYRLREGRLAL